MSLDSIKLIALDLDGTSLDKNHIFSERTINILQKISKKGIIVSIATGRSSSSVLDRLKELKLEQKSVPVVCFNGSIGINFELIEKQYQPNILFDCSLDPVSADLILEFAEKDGLVCQYYNGKNGEVYAVPKNPQHFNFLEKYSRVVGKKQTILSNYQEACNICKAAKILIMTEDSESLIDRAKQQFGVERFNIINGSPEPFFVEFLEPNVSKGEGLKIMCSKLNIDLKEVISFGDGDNDVEMLRYSGIGIAMKNAKKLAKEAADLILEWSNNEDGVARYLEEIESKLPCFNQHS